MNLNIQKELNRLRNLKQNQNKSDTELLQQAQINIARKKFSIDERFIDKKEALDAKELFDSYVGYYGFEKLSDLEILGDLIYEEILKRRIQNHLNQIHKNNPDSYISKNSLQGLHDVEQRILELKVKLGIESEENKKDDLSALQLLKKRFHKYIQANKNEFTTVCASCGTILLLRKKVKDFKCLVHPFFAGRWYFNYEILKDCKDGKISKAQTSRYLSCSVDYIDWCFDNWEMVLERYKANKGDSTL